MVCGSSYQPRSPNCICLVLLVSQKLNDSGWTETGSGVTSPELGSLWKYIGNPWSMP